MDLAIKACKSRTRDGSGEEPCGLDPTLPDAAVMDERRLLIENAMREMSLFVNAVRPGSWQRRRMDTVEARQA